MEFYHGKDRHKFNFDNIADWIDDNIKTTR